MSKNTELEIVEIEDMRIRMRDGCILSARVWMPKNAVLVPVPAILEHLPYRKRDGTDLRDCENHTWFAKHGYACVRTDMRGNGDSQGLMADEYLQQELDDAIDIIEFLAAQKWCTGKIGMMGISWGGFNSLQVAAMAPKNLNAVITVCSSADRFADDIHYKGGCLLGVNFTWAARMLSYSSRPPDPTVFGKDWKKEWLNRLKNLPLLADVWLSHQQREAYWKHGSICENYHSIKIPVLSIGGWHDGYRNTVTKLVENLNSPVKGIIGPWNHRYPHQAEPEPKIGFLQEALRWWDRWLRGKQTNVENDPDYRLFLMDSISPSRKIVYRPGRWIAKRKNSGINCSFLSLNLGENTLGAKDKIVTPISISSPIGCGSGTGDFFPYNFGMEMPAEQTLDDDKSSSFDGSVLSEPLSIVGGPKIEVEVCSDKPLAQLAFRLCDVSPEGISSLITHGFLNLTMRNSFSKPKILTDNEKFKVTLELDQVAYLIPAGHRLRLSISNVYWPFIWPSPETPKITIFSGKIMVPIKESCSDQDNYIFEKPVIGKPSNIKFKRQPSSDRREFIEKKSREQVLEVFNDTGVIKNLDHGLETDSSVVERFSIKDGDPLSARINVKWRQRLTRKNWNVSTRAELTVTCSEDEFFLIASVVAFENNSKVFTKKFSEKIKRLFI